MPSRLHIWKTFISIGDVEFSLSREDVDRLARENEINGRQIKNVVKTARLLAKQGKKPLGLEHVELVLRVRRGEFGV